MYELIVMITVCILTATILCGVEIINSSLEEKGYRKIEIPKRWFT